MFQINTDYHGAQDLIPDEIGQKMPEHAYTGFTPMYYPLNSHGKK